MKGHLHPLTQFMRESVEFFESRGFKVIEGPEIETEWYNFDALNVAANHPSRDVQDTFWIKSNERKVLRTQTTAADVRFVKENNLKPPFKLIVPGRVFRNEATDQTHEHTFYQLEGIAVGEDLNMGHLIGILDEYVKATLGGDIKTRVRPHLYPFVEPGMDMDVLMPNGKWREMLPGGMAHPVVLKNMGIDPNKYQGIMWGMGFDRLVMTKFEINDVRLSYSGDLRFLKQF